MGSAGRFDIIRSIGQGGQGQTYLARDRDTGERVALKRLALRLADNWKAMELFEREGEVLQTLTHPRIPGFIATFVEETDDGPRFYLAQQYVEGTSLQEKLNVGERWDVARATEFSSSLLEILTYLGSLRPPIVHRDLKPANIIERADGSWALVDFGAVQAIVPAEAGGSTVVGTTGYVPPEQVMGRAEPASDQYALAATVLHMMTGRHPGELTGMNIDVARQLNAPEGFTRWLQRMLEPCPEDRFDSASSALGALESHDGVGESSLTLQESTAVASPENHASRSDLTRQAARLDLPVSVEEGQVCFSVWSPLIPTTIKPTGEGPMVGAAWCAMAASAFLITGGWIITGLVAAMVSFGLIFGLAGRFTQIVVDEESLAIMRGSSLFARVGARLGLAAIDDFVARDASLLVLVGVREYAIPMETPDEAERLAGLLRGFLLSIDSRPRPLAKRTQISAGD